MTSHLGNPKPDSPEEKPLAWHPRWDLEENADWSRDLVEHSGDLLCVHDLQGRFLAVNPVPARVLGYSVEEILQIPMRDLIAPEFRDQFEAYLKEIQRTGKSDGILAVMTRLGQRRIWEYHNTLRTEGVETPVVRGIAHDITERVAAEKALKETNRQLRDSARDQELLLQRLTLFRALLDQSNDGVEVVDPETLRLLDVNETECAQLGYSREELLSMTIFDINPDLNGESVAGVRERLRKDGFIILEGRHRRKDGTLFPVEVNIKPVKLDREYHVSVARDITERKLRDGRLQEYERVVESLDEMIVVVDREHRYILANQAFLRYRGLSRGDVIGQHVAKMLHREEYETAVKPQLDECFRGEVVNYEMKYEYPELGTRDLSITYLPVEGPGGIDRVACVLRDFTERKRAAALLEESERRLRAIHERAPVGIALVDSRNGRFLQVNPKFCEIAGRTQEEMLQLGFRDITHPEDLADGNEQLRRLVEENCSLYEIEKRYVRPDGTPVWVSVSVVPMWKPGEEARWHMAIAQDITERVVAEEALRASEERMRLAQQAAGIGVFERNMQTGGSSWSPEMEAIFGLPPGMAPKTVDALVQLVHPEDRERLRQVITESFSAGTGAAEWRVIWPDGSLHWVSGRWRMFNDEQGRPLRALGVDFDITDRKQVEEELRQAKERLAEEKLYLEQEIDTELGFEEIIGRSKELRKVMESAGKVAPSDATVLLLGETGTGKELIARAIHRLSRRAGESFIKMNCAAIPSGLLESELFGNEKGAFTGAVNKKIGRLELADKGTIFLDEVGEISLELQPKLLRVLQDQEFERLGGTQTLKVNFRLIAATNQDLGECVRKNEFRSDLYYRLNVFPILLPPLRERREDIPLLVEHFVQKSARRMNKVITSIPKKTMDALVGWNWPGNIRELENFLERSVILTNGSVLAAPLTELRGGEEYSISHDDSLKGKEREYILRALLACNGQISGPRGAAARLGLKRTTLQSKLKNLGIHPRVPPHPSS